MRRYRGEALPDGPRIAVVSNDAIGNYVVVTPLLQMLRERHKPSRLAYFSGPRTEELWSREPILDFAASIFSLSPREGMALALAEEPPDLIVNVEWSSWAKAFTAALAGPETLVCGPSVGVDGRSDLPFADDDRGRLALDQEWIAADLTTRYPFLDSGFIGEIFCRLAYLDGPVPGYRLSSGPPLEAKGTHGLEADATVPDILIAMSASLAEKLWPLDSWQYVLRALRKAGRSVGLLGAKPSSQRQFWLGSAEEEAVIDGGLAQDLRGRFTLPGVVGVLDRSRAVLTIDNGILHLAAATNTPTVGLYREGIHRLWAPPSPRLRVLTPGVGSPVSSISPDEVLEALTSAL